MSAEERGNRFSVRHRATGVEVHYLRGTDRDAMLVAAQWWCDFFKWHTGEDHYAEDEGGVPVVICPSSRPTREEIVERAQQWQVQQVNLAQYTAQLT